MSDSERHQPLWMPSAKRMRGYEETVWSSGHSRNFYLRFFHSHSDGQLDLLSNFLKCRVRDLLIKYTALPEILDKTEEMFDELLRENPYDNNAVYLILSAYCRLRRYLWSYIRSGDRRSGDRLRTHRERMERMCNLRFEDLGGELFSSVMVADYELTCSLTTYGACYGSENCLRNSTAYSTATLQKFFIYVAQNVPGVKVHGDTDHQAKIIMSLMEETNGKMSGKTERGFQRIIFIVLVLQAVLFQLEENPSLNNCILCIQLFFETISAPFVSTDEIREFLCFSLGIESDDRIENMIEIYKNLFRSCNSSVYSPRSLKHLTRCAVRKLGDNNQFSFPTFVESLGLPEKLKYFLLCK